VTDRQTANVETDRQTDRNTWIKNDTLDCVC